MGAAVCRRLGCALRSTYWLGRHPTAHACRPHPHQLPPVRLGTSGGGRLHGARPQNEKRRRCRRPRRRCGALQQRSGRSGRRGRRGRSGRRIDGGGGGPGAHWVRHQSPGCRGTPRPLCPHERLSREQRTGCTGCSARQRHLHAGSSGAAQRAPSAIEPATEPGCGRLGPPNNFPQRAALGGAASFEVPCSQQPLRSPSALEARPLAQGWPLAQEERPRRLGGYCSTTPPAPPLQVARMGAEGALVILRRTDVELAIKPPSKSLYGRVYSLRYSE